MGLEHPLFHLDAPAALQNQTAMRHLNLSRIVDWQRRISSGLAGASDGVSTLIRSRPSCAVVGSSGLLIGSRLGDEIDAADVVIRMNSAPTARHEADVGRRTSVRFATMTPYRSLMRAGPFDAPVVVYCNTAWLGVCWSAIETGDPVLSRPSLAPRVSPRLVLHGSSILGTRRILPTTGMLAVLTALRLCSSVAVYGFGSTAASCAKYYLCHSAAQYTGLRALRRATNSTNATRWGTGRERERVDAGTQHAFLPESRWLASLAANGTIRWRASAEIVV